MLIAMAGLSASGKSTLAERLNEALNGTLLNKDEVRAFLFGERVDYSAEQNDLCMSVIYDVAVYLLRQDPDTVVIVDGRTYSKIYQIEDLKKAAERAETPLRIVECVCSEASARRRLESTQNDHPAQDRDFEMYSKSKATAEPIPQPKLVINTDERTPAEGVQDVLAYLERA